MRAGEMPLSAWISAPRTATGTSGNSWMVTYDCGDHEWIEPDSPQVLAGWFHHGAHLQAQEGLALHCLLDLCGGMTMQDDEIRELFHRFELRLERLDTKMDNLEKSFADLRSEMRGRMNALETRLDNKAGNWVVSFWGTTLAMLIAAAFAPTKWL
jgi:hypothetical protein